MEVASIESEDGQVRELVATDDLEPLLVPVHEDSRSTRRLGDDVGRGYGEPVGGDHDTRAGPLHDPSPPGPLDDAQARDGGRQAFGDRGCVPCDDGPHAPGRQAAATRVEEQGLARHPRPEKPVARRKVFLERMPRLPAERDDPLLAPLPQSAQQTLAQIDVPHVQADQFAHAKAGGVEQLEDRPVALAERRSGLRRLDQLDRVLLAQILRQPPLLARRRDQLRRVAADRPPRPEELQERSDGGELARDRRLLVLSLVERGEELADREVVDLLQLGLRPRFAVRAEGQEAVELLEVRSVVADGVGRDVALELEVAQEALDPFHERRAHAFTARPSSSAALQRSSAASAASTWRRWRSLRSRTLRRSSSEAAGRSPKLMFAGWKCSGSAEEM